MPFRASGRGAYGPQGQRVLKGPLAPVWTTSGTLPAGGASAYSFQLVATDDSGDAPTYSLASGTIPTGISLSSSGLLSGTPSASGTFNFTVRATDVNGRFTDSSTLTIVVSLAAPSSGVLYQTPGTYTWTAPAGVTRAHVVAIGGGGAGSSGNSGGAGGGGGLGWKNNIVVVPGSGYTVVVGAGGVGNASTGTTGQAGGDSYFINTSTVRGGGGAGGVAATAGTTAVAAGGSFTGDGGGSGGVSGYDQGNLGGAGGGGAGGYAGSGGAGGQGQNTNGSAGSGGGAGGGTGSNASNWNGSWGGGTGVYGQGANGAGGSLADFPSGGGGGSGGQTGASGNGTNLDMTSPGANYGGGGGGPNQNMRAGDGGKGAVRIIWGGTNRAFPSTNVNQNYIDPSAGGTNETII